MCTAARLQFVSVCVAVLALGAATNGLGQESSAGTSSTPHASGSGCPKDSRHGGHHEHPARGEPSPEPWDGLHDVDVSGAFTFKPELGEEVPLRYRLSEPALVLMRVRATGTRELYLATILNWERREAGEHTERWNGLDYSGNPIDMSKASITVVAERAEHTHDTMPLDPRDLEEIVHAEERHEHGTHHRWAEEVPLLKILEPAPHASASGLLLIRSAVDESRRGYGDQYGYGVRYYVDGVLAREEFYQPESNGQFSYRLDTTAFPDGEHTIQVGMCDHHQHASSASVPVVFRNGG